MGCEGSVPSERRTRLLNTALALVVIVDTSVLLDQILSSFASERYPGLR